VRLPSVFKLLAFKPTVTSSARSQPSSSGGVIASLSTLIVLPTLYELIERRVHDDEADESAAGDPA
jgi:hypothetical protein